MRDVRGVLGLRQVTTFTTLVRELVPTIPRGKVLTYGRLAAAAGSPRAAMSAGNALGAPSEIEGWHRVVRSDGRLAVVGQAELLRAEGVGISNGRVELAKYLWEGPGD